MLWTELPIHFVDFEGSTSSGVLEFGVVTLHRGGIVNVDTRVCRATGRIRPEDSAVHRLTEETVNAGAPFATEFDRFAGYRECGLLAAHFSGAENSMLKSVWPYPRSSPDFLKPGEKMADWGPWIDSARLCAEVRPATSSLQLETLVATLGLQNELDVLAVKYCPANRCFYHAALFDALAGALVLTALVKEFRPEGATVAWLVQASVANPKKRERLSQQDLLF